MAYVALVQTTRAMCRHIYIQCWTSGFVRPQQRLTNFAINRFKLSQALNNHDIPNLVSIEDLTVNRKEKKDFQNPAL